MYRRWRRLVLALILWMAVPYVFDLTIPSIIQMFSGERLSFQQWLDWAFPSQAFVTALIWIVIPAAVGTLILWLLPISRMWIGIIVGSFLGPGLVFLVARIVMKVQGGFEENIDIFIEALNLSLPASWVGAYAGALRFKDRVTPDFSGNKATLGSAGPKSAYSKKRYLLAMSFVLLVSTVLWLFFFGRIRRSW